MIEDKSLDVFAAKLAQLRELFPEVLTEGKIDFKRLRDVLGDEVSFNKEHYELSWAGKSDARAQIQKATSATLIPDDSGIAADGCGNIFIEGENLEVLHVLQRSYFGKIKMIYIDPPYNTGNDSFVYPDDYSERQDEYKKRAGITDKDGFLNKADLWKKNSKESGQFHSVWLSMMYPRLYLARNLLREDGVIFISIDDNEISNLKMLLDEVFGSENFIGQIANINNPKGRSDDKFIAIAHEYLLIYAKNKQQTFWLGFEPEDKVIVRYKKEDENGEKFREIDLRKTGDADLKEDREDMFYYFYFNEVTREIRVSKEQLKLTDWLEIIPIREDGRLGRWRWGFDTAKNNLNSLLCRFMPKRKIWGVFEKDYLISRGVLIPTSAWTFKDVNSERGSEQFIDLDFAKEFFPKPKPIGLVKRTLLLTTNSDDIILDFFSGSGTTAHAVLDLNEQDGGNRQFICVQLPELLEETSEAYKANYRTIADICKARISKVIAKIQVARDAEDTAPKQALGFKSFKLAPSNFKQWRGDVDEKSILEQLELFKESEEPHSENQNMLIELLLKSGFPLTAKVEINTIAGQELYNVESGKLLFFFDDYNDTVKDFIFNLKPKSVVCLNRVFKNNDKALTNFQLGLKDAGIELQII